MAWIKPIASAALVVVFAVTVGLFIGALRSGGPGAGGGSIPNLVTTVPADGTSNVAVNGQIEIHYSVRPSVTPAVKLEPVAGVTLAAGYWEGTTYVIPYAGLKTAMTYRAELDQDSTSAKGEHKQLKYRWSFTTAPKATALTPNPSIHAQPPTTTGPLIWYWGGGRLIAVDWQGTDGVGQLMLTAALQSPDGSLLWYRSPPAPPGVAPRVFDRTGAAAGTLPGDPIAIWADDSQHVCRIAAGYGSTPSLYVQTPSSLGQSVMPLQSGGWVAACSWANGRAVVVLHPNYLITGIEVIQLVDHKVLYQQGYPNPPAWLAASRDGLYAAEVYGWPGSNTSSNAGMTMIRDLTTGQVVARLPNFDAHGFSWDGSLVVGVVGGQSAATEIQVVEWRTQRIVWRLPYPGDITSVPGVDLRVLPRPNANDVALAFPYSVGTGSAWDLYVVHPDGSAKHVLRAPITPAF
jgi:Big-like domain-containing protein